MTRRWRPFPLRPSQFNQRRNQTALCSQTFKHAGWIIACAIFGWMDVSVSVEEYSALMCCRCVPHVKSPQIFFYLSTSTRLCWCCKLFSVIDIKECHKIWTFNALLQGCDQFVFFSVSGFDFNLNRWNIKKRMFCLIWSCGCYSALTYLKLYIDCIYSTSLVLMISLYKRPCF